MSMRTDFALDDELSELVARACQLTGITSEREVVCEALRTFINLHQQAEVRALRGQLKWEGDLHEQRLFGLGY
jgi:Arc/MetJ family transcription regulator